MDLSPRPSLRSHRVEREHLVDAGQPLDELGIFRRQHFAFGALEPLVARRQIQRRAARFAVEPHIRARRFDPAEVIERVVLAREGVSIRSGIP